MYFNEKHKQMVENRGDNYKYIGSYKSKEISIDGKNKKMNKTYIRVKCPYCGKKYDIDIYTFKKGSSCTNCCHEYEKSFAYHIEEELGLDLNDVWDWEENGRLGINPWDITKQSHETVYIWCQDKWYHGSYDIIPNLFYSGNRCPYCSLKGKHMHPKDSFGQWLIDTYGNDAIEKYWSPKNTVNPFNIAPKSAKVKIWILCQEKDYHNDFGGYELIPNDFFRGSRCPYCNNKKVHPKDSFAQWGIDNIDEDFLIKYWSKKNTLNPWKIAPRSTNEIWIYCQEKDYHNDEGGYLTTCDRFYSGSRCGYCGNNKVHPKDSFGYLYPEKAKYWSSNNEKSPYEVAVFSHGKYLFKCEKCGKEFERYLNNINRSGNSLKCPDCTSSQLEQETSKMLQKYNIKYIPQKEYKGLVGTKGGNLSYDFYLPDYNLLIECQGIQHEKWIEGWVTKEGFEQQLEHDHRKKQYTIDHNINFLEIWYYDIDNIEEILTKQLNL